MLPVGCVLCVVRDVFEIDITSIQVSKVKYQAEKSSPQFVNCIDMIWINL